MKERLKSIYEFLIANRAYNKELQERHYTSLVSSYGDTKDRVVCLLYDVANTQSQPKIDNLSEFYQSIYGDIDSLISFRRFVKKLSGKESSCYKDLFQGLRAQKGWGDKTSALFAKVVYHLHNGQFNKNLKIWDDAPQYICGNDQIYLPVDSVINAIFKQIGCKKCNFFQINHEINKYFDGASIEVWDDLWFWGFITQKGSGGQRIFKWNLNKYWSLEHSNKDNSVIKEIEEKSGMFLKLLDVV